MRNPEPKVARPFLILAVALVSQLSAGMLYWWPALVPGLQATLALSDRQASALVACANSGPVLGVLGGLFHSRFGSRSTALVGSAGISSCFLTIAVLISAPIPPAVQSFALWICFFVTLSIVTFSYMLYSSCFTAAVAMFEKKNRGSIVGLSTGMYGAAAGVFGALQAALFPSVTQTANMLFFFSAFSFIPFLLCAAIFPGVESYDAEGTPMQQQSRDQPVQTTELQETEPLVVGEENDDRNTSAIVMTYYVAWAVVIILQLSGVSQAFELPQMLYQGTAVILTIAVLGFFVPSIVAPHVIYERQSLDTSAAQARPEPPLREVLTDRRFLYLCFGTLTLVGGGGVALLVQAPNLAQSRIYLGAMPSSTKFDPEVVNRVVRSYVTVFSGCNMAARLIVGRVMDWGNTAIERHMWKYNIVLSASLAISIALFTVGFAQSWLLYLAIAVVGFCHGTWFASTPALVTVWFGVQQFPRNQGLISSFVLIGSTTLASTFPDLLRFAFGEWATLHVLGGLPNEIHQVCAALICTMPSFSLLAVAQMIFYISGRRLRSYVRHKMELYAY